MDRKECVEKRFDSFLLCTCFQYNVYFFWFRLWSIQPQTTERIVHCNVCMFTTTTITTLIFFSSITCFSQRIPIGQAWNTILLFWIFSVCAFCAFLFIFFCCTVLCWNIMDTDKQFREKTVRTQRWIWIYYSKERNTQSHIATLQLQRK